MELPPVGPEIMRTASERHQKGMMSPWVYQVLSQVKHFDLYCSVSVQNHSNCTFILTMFSISFGCMGGNAIQIGLSDFFSLDSPIITELGI